ncbi:MAG: 1,4-alpha-glucan branching protein GlgB, partial [Gammaproteobacteria bacterium]|nr:1,4-alpha-glucan branching protein GlgB [Gammaproteobacteria bacterium]
MSEAIVSCIPNDPFAFFGSHCDDRHWVVRTMQPQANSVELVDADGHRIATMECVRDDGLFETRLPLPASAYRFKLHELGGHERLIDDPYRFPSLLGDIDRHLIGEGTHLQLYRKLGAHLEQFDGVDGVQFAVWAPNAIRISVVGPFNKWDGRCHPMRLHPANGVWDIFIPGLCEGDLYKFEISGPDGKLLPLKTDPFARRMEPPPGNASIIYRSDYQWQDDAWIKNRAPADSLSNPMAIYEVHLGSWTRNTVENNRQLTYKEMAATLVPYVKDMGYTHVELLPVSEHPFTGSWGYQPIGMFAPTCRFGEPDELKCFVDACHQAGIGVIMDWVPAHFPKDDFGLGLFDGTHLYEHADPRLGLHQDWGTLIFNLGRKEVVNYLISNALFWIEEFHIDGLRVDAVASLLYLDYSRKPGEWIPNRHGGNENLEAIDFLKRMNELVHAHGAVTMAEESTAWPMVSRPTYLGGLGFTYKWNMGWMHDSLSYIAQDPVHRKYHHDRMTFSLIYAFSENFILPLSHDEVVHGKGSIINRMPGDDWQKFANLRLYYTYMYCHPGKKLMFMGNEFGQLQEWNHDTSLDWHLLEQPLHAGVRNLVRDLNSLYTRTPALFEVDFDTQGFIWIDCDDNTRSILAFLRQTNNSADFVVVICNFTPMLRQNYRVGVPLGGAYVECLNSD